MYNYWNPPAYVAKHYRDKEQQEKIQKEMNAQFYKDVGLWLRKHRQLCGYTVDQICLKSGVDRAAYFYYERGTKRLTLLHFMLLCRVLKTDFHYNESFRLEPEEKEIIEALRRRDVKTVLRWLLEEI